MRSLPHQRVTVPQADTDKGNSQNRAPAKTDQPKKLNTFGSSKKRNPNNGDSIPPADLYNRNAPLHDFNRIALLPSAPFPLQAKLNINRPGDQYEREADRMADRVMQLPTLGKIPPSSSNEGRESHAPTSPLARNTALSNGTGKPLPPPIKAQMEGAFGVDFSRVRIHNDQHAANLSASIHAKAFTVGNDIFFNDGQYAPERRASRKLLAHELTHVNQQNFALPTSMIQRSMEVCLYRNWGEEVKKMTPEEIKEAIKDLNTIMEHGTSDYTMPDAYQECQRGLTILKEELEEREAPIQQSKERTAKIREGLKVGQLPQVDPATQLAIDLSGQYTLVTSFLAGCESVIPPVSWDALKQQLEAHPGDFLIGYNIGHQDGILAGLKDLGYDLVFLIKAGHYSSPHGIYEILHEEAFEYLRDPEAYKDDWRQIWGQVKQAHTAIIELTIELIKDPTIWLKWSNELGIALGQQAGRWLTEDFFRASPRVKGQFIGSKSGRIAFEVAVEIIIGLLTRGAGNTIRRFVSIGRAARSGRLANVFRNILQKTKSLKNLGKVLGKAEDAGDLGKTTGRAIDSGKRSSTGLQSGKPEAKQLTGKPEAKQLTGKPEAKQLTGKPEAKQLTGKPEAKQLTGKPEAKQLTGKPEAKQLTGKPEATSKGQKGTQTKGEKKSGKDSTKGKGALPEIGEELINLIDQLEAVLKALPDFHPARRPLRSIYEKVVRTKSQVKRGVINSEQARKRLFGYTDELNRITDQHPFVDFLLSKDESVLLANQKQLKKFLTEQKERGNLLEDFEVASGYDRATSDRGVESRKKIPRQQPQSTEAGNLVHYQRKGSRNAEALREQLGHATIPPQFEAEIRAGDIITLDKLPNNLQAEIPLGVTARADRITPLVDSTQRIVYELKPNTPNAITKGLKQVIRYTRLANDQKIGGFNDWRGVVVVYDAEKAKAFIPRY